MDLHKPITTWFLLAVLFFGGLVVSFAFPPSHGPDEFDHVERAYLLSTGQLRILTPVEKSSGGEIDEALERYLETLFAYPFAESAAKRDQLLATAGELEWSGDTVFAETPGTAYYLPLVYVPQALGIALGKALSISIENSYLLARFLSLLSGVVLLFAASRAWTINGPIWALILLPATIAQAASATIDFVSLSLFIYILCIFLNQMNRAQAPRVWSLIWLAFLIVTVAGCRMHLAPSVLLLAALGFRFRSIGALLLTALTSLIIISWYLYALDSAVDLRSTRNHTTIEIIYYYAQNPWDFFNVIANTLSSPKNIVYYFESFIGHLGFPLLWQEARLAPWVYSYLTLFLTAIILVSLKIRRPNVDGLTVLVFFLVSFSSVFIVFFALLVAWTPDHPAYEILGVQGRYFITSLIPLLFCIAGAETKFSFRFTQLEAVLVITFGIVSTGVTFRHFSERYDYWSPLLTF